MTYESGSVKHNPETGEVALRTIFPEDQGPQLANMAWLVATKNMGARNASSETVEGWDDLFVPVADVPAEVMPDPIPDPLMSPPAGDEPPVEEPPAAE